MIRVITFILTITFFFGCLDNQNQKQNNVYLYHPKNGVKSALRSLEKIHSSDSVFAVNYILTIDGERINQYYELPIRGRKRHQYNNDNKINIVVTLEQKSAVIVDGKPIEVYKFKHDALNSIDEENYIYYSEKLGIFRTENIHSRSFLLLVSHKEFSKEQLYYINNKAKEVM